MACGLGLERLQLADVLVVFMANDRSPRGKLLIGRVRRERGEHRQKLSRFQSHNFRENAVIPILSKRAVVPIHGWRPFPESVNQSVGQVSVRARSAHRPDQRVLLRRQGESGSQLGSYR